MKVVKKIKEKRSNIGEETIPDEKTYEFNVEKYPVVAPTILKISKTINEAIAQQEVVELSTDINDVGNKAKISIITRNAAESIVTQGEEKEETRNESLNIKKFKANSVFEINESYTIDHPDTQSPLEDIVKTLELVPCVATKDVIPNESLTISEFNPDQSLGKESEYKQHNKEAKITVISHSQKVVTEFIPSTKEGEIKHEQIPQKKKATQDYVEYESINVMEVHEAHTEGELKHDNKPTPVKSTIGYPLNEQLTISELHSEVQPEKYYPEIIVPTEIAEQLIVPSNNAVATFEIETSEKEGKYNPLQSPLEYTADISIIPEKSIQVIESNTQEKEMKIPEERRPDEYFAVSDIVSQSSIIVNSINQQENEEAFTSYLPESHTAILTLNNANKVCTSSIIEMNEVESDLKMPITPEMKYIKSTILGLEVPDITEVIANETESIFTSQSALELLPDTSFTESHSCIVTEATTSDFITNLTTDLKYKLDEAIQNFQEVEAKQISQVNIHETNVPLDETSKPTSVRPETSFAPIQCITVEQAIVAEQEQSLTLKVNPEWHKSITVPTHTLQAIVVDEVTTSNCVQNLEDTFKDNIQPTTKIANVNFIDDQQSIVVKEISAFESESNLILDDRPKNKQANPVISGHDVAEITEVISSDSIQQLNIEKRLNDKAKLEHLTYEACIAEETSVNELEDILAPDLKKQPKKVNITMDEVVGVKVIEHPVYEKEIISNEQIKLNTKSATAEFVPIEIADHSEIITGDYTLDLIQPEIPKLYAYHQPSTFESVSLYETDVSENEQVMTDDKIPLTCSANLSVVVEEAIEVTEITSDNRPEDISHSITPKEETAQANIMPFKSIEGQDVMACENVEKVKDKNTITAVAHVSQKPLHSLETSLMVSADSENMLSAFVMPNFKKAETNYAELDIPISVIEILTQEKELDFKAGDIPSHTLDKDEIVLVESHITSETMVCSSTGDFDELVPQSVYASTSKSPHLAIELLENAPFEKEGKLIDDDKIQERHAEFLFEEVKSMQVTEQIQLETKDDLVLEIKPTEKKTSITITGQDIAETSETKVESPIEELKIEFPKQELANTIQNKEVHSFEVSEIITHETESEFKDSERIKSKKVNVSIEDSGMSFIVTEIYPKEKETQFLEEIKPIHHHAEREILSHEGLQVNETNISICEEKLDDLKYTTKLVSQVIEPHECIEISEVNVQELENQLTQPVNPKIKHATHSFNENVGLIIKSTVINEQEKELIMDQFKTKTATKISNFIDYKAPENFEKITLESVKPIESTKESLHQASTEHILLESINTTVVNTQDREITFKKQEKTAGNIASSEYETGQTVNITEVFLGESESNLISELLPSSHMATSDMSETQQVASSFEVLPENTTHDLNVQTLPSTVKLIPQSTQIHSFEVAETICHETETPFKTITNLTMNCNYTIQSDQNILVTEIVTNESEQSFKVGIKNKGSEAKVVFDENQTVTIEEVETSDDVLPLAENLFQPINATKQLEPMLGVSVTEIRPEESEVAYEKQIKPSSKRVTQILPENQSLNVTSTVVAERETTIKNYKPDITQNAQVSSVYCPKTVVQLEENIMQMSTTNLNTIKPDEIFLESSQIPYDSVTQLEISPYEKESSMIITQSNKKEVATVNVDFISIMDTTEIITGDKESIYIPTTKPNARHAFISLTDSRPVSKIVEVKSEDNSSELELPLVVPCSAIPGQDVLHGIMITDNVSQDKEEIFAGEFMPSTSVAKINVENEKEIKTITEIITQEMEGRVKKLEIPSTKKAQVEISSGQGIAEKTEILSNTALGSLSDVAIKSSTAVPVQDTYESIQGTITITEDKEKPLNSNLVYEKSTVDINLEELKSINVTEIVVEDKEGKYIVSELPKTQTAGQNILPKEAAETSFVLADVYVTEFEQSKPKEKSANITRETHTIVAQTETTVHDSEEYFKHTELITKKAEFTMIPNKSLTITEVITDDNDKKLLEKEDWTSQKAITSFTSSHEVPQVSEIVSTHTTSDVIVPSVNTDNALVLQSELYNSAIATEYNPLEKETNFPGTRKFEKFRAEIKFKEDKSINVLETILNEEEQSLGVYKPEEKQASLTQSTFDVISISENAPIEKEQYFNSVKIPEGQKVNVMIEKNLNVQVSEVNIIDRVNDFSTPIQTSQTAHIPEISSRPVVNTTEIITNINAQDLPEFSKPEHSIASETHLTCQSLLQTELNISESEGIFNKPKFIEEKATIKTDAFENIVSTEHILSEKEGILKEIENTDLKQAKISLEEIKSSVIVSNVKSEDKESTFSSKPKRKTSVAKITSENMEAIVRLEEQTSEKEGKLNLKTPKGETAEVIFEDSQSEIIVSNVIPEDKEESLLIADNTYSTATITTENYESLMRNEQTVSEKEEDIIFKPKPDSLTACVAIEKPKKGALVSEVISNEKEINFNEKPITPLSLATTSTEEFKSLVTSETELLSNVDELKLPQTVKEKAAIVKLDELKHLIIETNISEDKETDFTVKPKRKTSVAKVTSDNMEAITRIELQPSEKEGNLNLEIPKDDVAQVTFENSQSGVIVSDIIPEDKEENILIKSNTYSTATITTENYESLIRNEQTVSEKEENITVKPIPDTLTASISIEKPKKSALVSEITSNEKETDFPEKKPRKTSQATISTEELKSLVTSEAQMLTNVDELKLPQTAREKSAKVKLDELSHLTIDEPVSNEVESIINEKETTQVNIKPTYIEFLPIESNEVIPEIQPTDITENFPKKYIAKQGKPTKNNSIGVNEDLILETTIDLKQIPTDEYRALITDTSLNTGKQKMNKIHATLFIAITIRYLDLRTIMRLI